MTKYFAKLDSNNKVLTITGVADRIATTEQAGIDYLNTLFNYPSWIQCSKDLSIRKNGAVVGSTYDENKDAFILKQPYPSWTLNETTCQWEAPSAKPDDGELYGWNEETTSWDRWDIVS